jgi:lysophospholipase L1-like esterase
LSVLDKASRVKANFFATIAPEAQLKQYRKCAEKISGKQHFLFLGDSLSDYDRGRNYISTVGCFLPVGYSVRNCGVGGDTLERIWLRLNGEKTTRNEMYDNIFSPNPDTIFIFTGANDSKLLSRNNYQTFVPEKDQPGLWNKIIVFLKKRTGAKIVLITSPDSYMPYQKALNDPLKKRGYNHSVFGDPASHDRFNARLKQVAALDGLDVIDFASVVRNHPDPQQLYVQDDGVHFSLKGHQLLAGVILRYLADGKKFAAFGENGNVFDEKLLFDGSNRVRLLNSSEINADKNGLTVIADIIPQDDGNDLKGRRPEALDMYIFKDRQFFLGRYGNRLYANFHDGSRYCAHTMSVPGKFPPAGKKSRIAAVFGTVPGGTSIRLYLDGAEVGRKTFAGIFPKSNSQFIELGSGWGGAWHYRGEICRIWTFPRALSAAEMGKFSQVSAAK